MQDLLNTVSWDQKTSHSAAKVGTAQDSVRAIGEKAVAVGGGGVVTGML